MASHRGNQGLTSYKHKSGISITGLPGYISVRPFAIFFPVTFNQTMD